MKKAVVVPSKTIGDALVLMIAANHLKKAGFDVTIMHDKIIELKNWFPKYNFEKYSDDFSKYDQIIYQHDNTKSIYINELKQKYTPKFSIFYFTYKKSKHGALDNTDVALRSNEPIVQSLAKSCKKFFNFNKKTLDTGVEIPKDLIFKKYSKRVVIHPSSSDKNKCWSKKKYIKLCKKIKKRGLQPAICVASNEREQWLFIKGLGIDLPVLNTLEDFASYLYESSYLIGNDSFAVHLASLLDINHIVIAGNKKLLKIWQPGWKKANLIFPPFWIPNFKHLRLREKHFQKFISVRRVYNIFHATHSKQAL